MRVFVRVCFHNIYGLGRHRFEKEPTIHISIQEHIILPFSAFKQVEKAAVGIYREEQWSFSSWEDCIQGFLHFLHVSMWVCLSECVVLGRSDSVKWFTAGQKAHVSCLMSHVSRLTWLWLSNSCQTSDVFVLGMPEDVIGSYWFPSCILNYSELTGGNLIRLLSHDLWRNKLHLCFG